MKLKQIAIILGLITFGYFLHFGQSYLTEKRCQETVRFALTIPKTAINNQFDKIKTTRAGTLGLDLTSIISGDSVKVEKKGIFKRWFGRRVNK